MADKESARAALYESIELGAESAKKIGVGQGSAALRDLAIAWRALAGGTQPGNIVVEK